MVHITLSLGKCSGAWPGQQTWTWVGRRDGRSRRWLETDVMRSDAASLGWSCVLPSPSPGCNNPPGMTRTTSRTYGAGTAMSARVSRFSCTAARGWPVEVQSRACGQVARSSTGGTDTSWEHQQQRGGGGLRTHPCVAARSTPRSACVAALSADSAHSAACTCCACCVTHMGDGSEIERQGKILCAGGHTSAAAGVGIVCEQRAD